jgi:hypothetical protein
MTLNVSSEVAVMVRRADCLNAIRLPDGEKTGKSEVKYWSNRGVTRSVAWLVERREKMAVSPRLPSPANAMRPLFADHDGERYE